MTIEEITQLTLKVSDELQQRLAEIDDPHKGNLSTTRHMKPETRAIKRALHGAMEIRDGLRALSEAS